jgi:hypothetical protein
MLASEMTFVVTTDWMGILALFVFALLVRAFVEWKQS